MELTRLRKIRDDLMEQLSNCECDEFDAVDSDLLEECAKGNESSLSEFESEYHDYDCEDKVRFWMTETHQDFYDTCHKIAALERKTYKEAFV